MSLLETSGAKQAERWLREVPGFPRTSTIGELPEDRVQDTAVAVIVDLDRRIDAAGDDEVHHRAVLAGGGDLDGLLRLEVIGKGNVVGLGSVEVQESRLSPSRNCRADPMPTVRAVDPFVAGGDHRTDAER
ncbi:MAG: hypothetical protein CM1200mP2_53650 [Planctomycetaceae bacterium]|nr:MAG: hypothetical protein CM1200mP2_53650 [Planctomycetaceae bacterium]